MRTRSSSNLPVVSPNPSTSNPKCRNRRRSKQPFILEESPVDTMADQRTMAELLRAPTEGYAEAIVVPSIIAEQFELKHSLINMMTSDQFFGLEKDNPHDHILIVKLTHAVNQQTSVVTIVMTTIPKQFQATPPPASVKVVEEICVTCGGAHPYYQCLTAGGNTFPELRDNIQGYISAAAVNLADLNDNLVDSIPEMFTDKHALDYSSPSLFDEYDDDLFEVDSDTENIYDDPFDSKGDKIKESKLLIDELDLPCEFLPSFEYDSFLSKDFSRVDALPSTNNEEKVFNLGILIQKNFFEIITHVVQDKKLAISHAFFMLEDFDPPLYELHFFKEVPRFKMLLPFSSKNEEKVFKPGIQTSRKVDSSLITKLSHQGYKVFKINQVLKSPVKIFLFSCKKDTHILVVPCLYFYPLDQF
uniref:Reverse transcriptase domain-containing protein n=1 Tax=Tanacetum cinerariifolium TaxID=118510 RepID=A0A6L2MPC0_TANCI|nr:reverse transcriptase domain-containing protein [Tanacetum cinerariifolium]